MIKFLEKHPQWVFGLGVIALILTMARYDTLPM